MKKSATEIMKEIKAIKDQIARLYSQEKEYAYKVVTKTTGTTIFEKECDFASFREKEEKLINRELQLKVAIDKFNHTTLVDGFGFTIIEGLARLAQLKRSIGYLEKYIKDGIVNSNYGETINVLTFDREMIEEKIKELTSKRSALLVAIDKTNLNNTIEV